MIDFHCHVIPRVDDGAKTEEEAVQMLQEAKEAGFTNLILTPHYIEGTYENSKKELEEYTNKLQEKTDLLLHLGTEAYASMELPEQIKEGIVSTVGESRYLLFELPMHIPILFLEELIYRLQSQSLIPIIAHPERYHYIQQDPNQLMPLIENGVLFQSNFGSIAGLYGRQAKKTVEKLLKHNYIHFLGTDCHRSHSIYTKIKDIQKDLNKIIDCDTIETLTEINPRKVLNNEEIDVPRVSKIRKVF